MCDFVLLILILSDTLHPYFLNNGKYVCGAKNIADKFNEYFTEIGPSLASEIDVSNKSPFQHISNVPVYVVILFSVHESIWYTKDYSRP